MSEAKDAGGPSMGTIEGGEHRLPVRVYFEDTDTARIVYHARFLHFMERARTEVLRCIGVNQLDLLRLEGRESFGFAVRSCQIDYLRPAVLDDVLEVRTTVRKTGAAYLDFAQDIWRDADQITAGSVRVVCLNYRGLPKRIPASMLERLESVLPTTPRIP